MQKSFGDRARRTRPAGAARRAWAASPRRHAPHPSSRAGTRCRAKCRAPLPSTRIPARLQMVNRMQFYIDGAWVDPGRPRSRSRSSTRRPRKRCTRSRSARRPTSTRRSRPRARAFATFSQTTREERVALLEPHRRGLQDAHEGHRRRRSPTRWARRSPFAEKLQAGAGLGHIASTLDVLKNYRVRGAGTARPWSCASRSASSA